MEMRSRRIKCEVFLKRRCGDSDVRERHGLTENVRNSVEKDAIFPLVTTTADSSQLKLGQSADSQKG
ncbi:hypothetical protein EVAR_21708_1 [Eumeta japonica]|uniref:Uncharacterized protein n=1 Tax=Eumeta variegata TaxID=151549 RepID=A0A4C1W7P2_EUMVA|nr:hypothetical protein EVAR_21708_1 [Eumeta japonica]